ncbi:MAG TPA: choice-of-anchor D domain-containing protein, partial [Flavobacteriales bacterium]|nr:choice-of-anchor D domain-containing protein [Flavobacteriales bacterium]
QSFYNTGITSIDEINLYKYYNDASSPDVYFDNIQIGLSPADWMSVDVSTDTISPGDSTVVNVTFSSCSLIADNYSGSILLQSNDPLNSPDTVAVSFTVVGDPEIALSDSCLDLDSIMVFTTHTDTLYIYNTGCDTLFVTDINNTLPEYTVSDTLVNVLPGDTGLVIVTFAPLSVGFYQDTLVILNNDTNLSVCLSGYSFAAPVMSVNPDSLEAILGCCDSTTQSFTIYNTGGSDLTVNLMSGEGVLSFFDGFEKGNLDNWVDQGGPYTKQVTTTAPAEGSYCLEMTGNPQNTTQQGVSHTFLASTPEYVGFYIKTSNTARYRSGYVDIGNSTDLDGLLRLYQQYDDIYINGTYFYNITTSNQWHHIELRNIDFTSKTYDLYLDGALMIPGQSFYNTGITSIDEINLYKYYNDASSPDVYFDNIQIGLPPADWMSLDVSTDTISPGDSTVVNVTFTSCPVNVGSYSGSILLSSNDPLTSEITIPVSFTVVGAGEIALSDSCLDLDSIMAFTTHTDSLYIYNTGCDTLFVTDINNTLPEYTLSDTAGYVLPGNTGLVVVTFSPLAAGSYSDNLVILNNDSTISICLTG